MRAAVLEDTYKIAVREVDDLSAFAFRALITHILPFDQVEDGLNLLAQHREDVAKILLDVTA